MASEPRLLGFGWPVLPSAAAHRTDTELTVTVSTPTIDIPVVADGTGVAPGRIHGQVARFKWVVIPFPCDVSANRGISSDVGTINAWRQGPIHVERECC